MASTFEEKVTPRSPPLVPHRDLRRPPHAPYQFSSLLDIPRRLLRRNATFRDSESSVGSDSPGSPDGKRFGSATAGVVRSSTRIKLRDVTLEDMYNGDYLPPITLKDFEDYLAFKERSAENLYFDVWFRNYHAAYQAYYSSSPVKISSERLVSLYQTGCITFLNSESPLELNLTSEMRKKFDDAAAVVATSGSDLPILPPQAFEAIRAEIDGSLHRSLSSFLQFSSGNADRNRGWFAKIVGLATFIVACVPTIVCAIMGQSRGWRALGIPLWWLGAVVFVGGYKRTCLIIFLFGDRRQLYPWELIRPSLEEAASSPVPRPQHSRTTSSEGSFASINQSDTKLESPDPSLRNTHQRNRSSSANTFDFGELGFAHVPSILLSPSISSRNKDTLYFAPEHLAPNLSRSSPTFAPLTKVLEPLVTESQREIVFAGAMYSVIATALMCAICFSVPNRR